MPFLLAEILNFQGSTHHIGVGSFSFLYKKKRGLFQTGIALYDGSVFTCFLSDPYLVERPVEKENAFQHETFSVDHNYKKHAGYGGL